MTLPLQLRIEEKSNGNGYQKYIKDNSAFDLGGYTVDLTSALFSFFSVNHAIRKKNQQGKVDEPNDTVNEL